MIFRQDQTPLRAGRGPRHLPALCVLAVVLAFGVAGAPDYGIAHDQTDQHALGGQTVQFLLGEREHPGGPTTRQYGAWFEVVLHAAERALGLTDEQHFFLSRYILSHVFFLVGAFACYLLADRLFQNRALALLVMLFLLCHPRLFGHSFFNSKDMPFFAMFLIALLFAHQALRAGSVRAHAGLGAWIGLIASVRPFALLLVALVPLVRGADFVRGSGRERARLLVAGGTLLTASVAAFFLALPWLWGDPYVRFTEWLGDVSNHPSVRGSLFLGELIRTDDRPWPYVPVWFAITTPPMVTVLALIGIAAVAARLVRPGRAGRAGAPLGFAPLLALAVLVPVVGATLLAGNVYNGWRHLYFIYGPVCLLACAGLAWLRQAAGRRLRALAISVAALGLAPAVAWIAVLHPHEHVYFNFLVDRKTPERLRTQFDMDYWAVSHKEALETLLALLPDRPDQPIPVRNMDFRRSLPESARSRFVHSEEFSAYFVSDYRYAWGEGVLEDPIYIQPIHVRKVFASTLYAIARLQVDDVAGTSYAEDYAAALASPSIAKGGTFSMHWDGAVLTYLREDCRPADTGGRAFELNGRFFLHVYGNDGSGGNGKSGGTAAWRYLHNEDFQFRHRGVVLRDGAKPVCMARVALDGYAVDGLRAGQMDNAGNPTWTVPIANMGPAALARAAALVAAREPSARGPYDVYWDKDEAALLYVRERCREEDRAAPFFLHVVPLDPLAAPPAVAERGFANRDFAFATHGAMRGDTCVLRARLPLAPAREAHTGQYVGGQGELWRVDVALSGGR